MDRYVERVNGYLDTFIEKEGYKVLRTEFVLEDGNHYLRVYIDLLDGADSEGEEHAVGINDCAKVSRRLSKWLDKEDFISEAYTLEVCSKGFLKEEDEL